MVRVVKGHVNPKHEAVWLQRGPEAQRLQSHRGKVEGEVEPLHLPGYRHGVSLKPLIAGGDCSRLLFRQVDTSGLEVEVRVQNFDEVSLSKMLHTKLEAGIPDERSPGHSFDLPPVLEHEVDIFVKFITPVDCKFSCGWWVGMNFPRLVPIPLRKFKKFLPM